MSRTVKIGYAYKFNATGTFNTLAYPTSITDPANNSATVKYRFDIGANVRAQFPAPQGQTQGKIAKREYDSFRRLTEVRVTPTGPAINFYE